MFFFFVGSDYVYFFLHRILILLGEVCTLERKKVWTIARDWELGG